MKITEEEYLKAKAIIKDYESQNPPVRVGVLVYDSNDFLIFKQSFHSYKSNTINNRQFVFDNKIYYRILNECDLCSLNLDEIFETDAGKQRPDYEEISYNMKMNLKPL